MSNMILDINGNLAKVERSLSNLNEAQIALVEQFVDQIVRCHDPDAIRSFLALREDPRIESILSLVTDLEEEKRDQLLFAAEELYDSAREEALSLLSSACETRLT